MRRVYQLLQLARVLPKISYFDDFEGPKCTFLYLNWRKGADLGVPQPQKNFVRIAQRIARLVGIAYCLRADTF